MSGSQQQRLFTDEPESVLPFEVSAEADQLVAQVVLNRPLETVYHYLVPEGLREAIAPGCRVRVPFGRGNQSLIGTCVGLQAPASRPGRLKSISELLDRTPLLSQEMLDLTHWMSRRYLCGWGQVIESVVPAGVKSLAGTRKITAFRLNDAKQDKLAMLALPKKQRAVVNVLLDAEQPMPVAELAAKAGCGTSPINALKQKGILLPVSIRRGWEPVEPAVCPPGDHDITLNPDQSRVLERIQNVIQSGKHQSILLYGVTGSGKTEIYIRAIQEVVSYGRQAIVLVPEISLTPQTIRRFQSRFRSVAVLHSHLSDADRHREWSRIAQGQVQVVVGARSAVFAPVPQLGLIVIDEEHETTFKQQTTPRYHAREVARERARQENVPLILGSATPTLESLQRSRTQQDLFLTLPKRVENRPLPTVSLVDVRNDPMIGRGHSIGRALFNAMTVAIEQQGQVILFLNLRGYSPILWCGTCQAGVVCPHCDVTLTWHRDREELLCHTCEFSVELYRQCPVCEGGALRFFGSGTQRLEQEVKTKFPQARVLRMDSDSMRKPDSHHQALESFRQGEVEILLGTQMIAKGLDFPRVTLVGVIDADTLLHQPDLRSSERTFQLIAQVAGRTGRGAEGGRVLVQTMNPDEPVIQFAAQHDYFGFAKEELQHRREMNAPPFSRWARLVFRGRSEEVVQTAIRETATSLRARLAESTCSARILGPAPAPLVKLRGEYRFHLLIQFQEEEWLRSLWELLQKDLRPSPGVEWIIDVDPIDMR